MQYLAKKNVDPSFCTCFPSTSWIGLCWAGIGQTFKTKHQNKTVKWLKIEIMKIYIYRYFQSILVIPGKC